MRNAETPRPDDGGPLSTEDLAGSGRQDIESESSEFAETPPAYPGEATSGPEEREGDVRQEPLDEPGDGATDEPVDEPADETGDRGAADENEPLLGAEQEEFRARWQQIQSRFVDDPKDSVNAADQLVAETMQALATTFSSHKRDLEGQWHRGEEVPTEDLRVALQQYRSFFNRLLST
ncbi:hypothetical protein ACFYNY_33255 [Streptomyces sp. NPDC006530]|uniref:hypothetical protein n=1 Tax=Streptomyces sp. NPDC006530 TaxID=3364750 RepID=UPI00369CAC00